MLIGKRVKWTVAPLLVGQGRNKGEQGRYCTGADVLILELEGWLEGAVVMLV